ncbi:glycoside hydrolase, putative [Syntrophotalea carbinolica DSM 2380]|uniref:beta-N-acetylhexosaminidase n=1 Tax=Syntrophotalea carbinolica (strain DSM 2380 / NBRC 103641 / GraBd1) TaxID=338963 RepID=Q3A4Z0_SYNC1|nr:glycoside hydrolase family 3 protein [Syntrophotalea carbinolica]ABA88567.1 glycoside hydrolase, putative [Syntrophotalea carbinolica DSM 2380]
MALRLILSCIGIIVASWALPVHAATGSVHKAAARAQAKLPLGQLLMVGFAGADLDKHHPILEDIKQRHLGGVVLFNYGPDRNHPAGNIRSPQQLRRLTAQLQQAAGNTPLLIAIDQEGGRINRLKQAYGFPPTVSYASLGRRNDLALTRRQAQNTARTLQQAGINLNLSPVVDLNVNPANPIIGRLQRSFSAEPGTVISHAREVIRAHHQQGVLCCLKHFPGHGSSTADSHKGFVDVTNTWSPRELLPFATLIDEGLADAVLTAHVFNSELDPRYPATLSERTVHGVLRKQLGFQGVVISDDLTMGAIADQYRLEDAVEKALNAGVDILLLADNSPDTTSRMIAIMQKLIDSGRVTRKRIVQALKRIDDLKSHLRSNIQRQP